MLWNGFKCLKLDGYVWKCIEVIGNRYESLLMDGGVWKIDVSVL